MTLVYIVEGYFGADEWIESVWSTEEAADREVGRLWEKRISTLLDRDDNRQGVLKFGVSSHEVRS